MGIENEPFKTIEGKLFEIEELIPIEQHLSTSIRWDIEDTISQLKGLINKLSKIEQKK